MNETLKTLINRSSCNKFKPGLISDEELDLILQAGLAAPSGMNKQTPRFIVVRDPEMVKKLSKMNAAVMGADMDPFYGAPEVICVLVKKEVTYAYDGSLALGNMLNAAYSLGVGARWIHRCKEVFASEEGQALLKEWGLEEDLEGVGFCILGYPDMEIVPKERVAGRITCIG